MPRLPDATSLGPRPVPRSQRGIVSYRGDIAEAAGIRAADNDIAAAQTKIAATERDIAAARLVGQGEAAKAQADQQAGIALVGLGEGISKAAQIFEYDRRKFEEFEAERKWVEHSSQADVTFVQAKANAQPGAAGFTQGVTELYEKQASDFLEKIPAHLRPKYEVKVEGLRGRYREGGTVFELNERQKYYGDKTEELTGTLAGAVKANPDSYDERIAQADEFIETSGMLPRTKAQARSLARNKLIGARIEGLVQAGRYDEAQSIAARTDEERQKLATTPAEVRAAIDEASGLTGVPSSYLYRTAGKESSFDPNAKASTSSAEGLFQFTDKTWAGVLARHGGKYGFGADTPKTDARANALMAAEFTKENAAALRAAGIPVNEKTLYIAHFAGEGGAVKLLTARADVPAADVLPSAAKANRSIFYEKDGSPRTVGQVVARLSGGMSGAVPQPSGDGPAPVGEVTLATQTLIAKRDAQLQAEATKVAAIQAETWERAIIDANAGVADLPKRASIETDLLLTESQRNTLLRQYDATARDMVKLQRYMAKFHDPNAGPFNPFEPEDRKAADAIYRQLGGDAAALRAVVERTGILPETLSKGLRGHLVSGDVERTRDALNVVSNLLVRQPTIFTKTEGGKELEEAAVAFRHYVDDLGFSPDEAAKRYTERQSVEYKAKVTARLESEDINKVVKDSVSLGDVANFFDQSSLPFTDPNVGFSPEMRRGMLGDYEELFRESYAKNGDIDLSKKLALEQMRKVWGVSSVTGQATVMRYPPELAPALRGLPNASVEIARQAVEAVKAETGRDVRRESLILTPVPAVTPDAYRSGQAPPYLLSWVDENGVLHSLNPGRAFVPDVQAMRTATTQQRGQSMERAVKARELQDVDAEVTPPTLRQYGFP